MRKSGGRDGEHKGGALKQRLKGLRKRKKAQPRFQCDVVALKMRILKTKGRLDR
jgi:hypothetical protein